LGSTLRESKINGPLKKHGIQQCSVEQTLVASLVYVVENRVLHSEGSTEYDDGVVFGPGDVSKWFEADYHPEYSVFRPQVTIIYMNSRPLRLGVENERPASQLKEHI
jgi:hypothetical protein